MNIKELKNILEEIVHKKLYTSSNITKETKRNLKKIKEYLNNSNDIIADIRTILLSRTNESYFAYKEYIIDFLCYSDLTTKLEILNNQEKYKDIIDSKEMYISLWNTLKLSDKLNYLENKKKYTSIDIILINNEINNNGNFKENILLNEILNNKDIHNKIDPFTINLNYSYNLLSLINLTDFEMCCILTKDSYTKLLLKKCKNFSSFYTLYENNNKIFNLISNNSLIFDNKDNEQIYNFILDNPNFIGKFNNKYLELFSILEITNFSKIKTLDNEAFSAIIQKLYKYNNSEANTYFSEKNLQKCAKHSINIYPFNDLNKELQDKIFNTYTLFNRFIDTIMIEAINNSFQEENIVSILRDDNFINDMSSYAIELLINKLSFKSSFNMLQRINILEKINHLNITIKENDKIFIKGFLDSPALVFKSEHNMIYNMLSFLNKEDTLYYIYLPYILHSLSNYEVVNIIINKEIEIDKLLSCDELYNKLTPNDITNIINNYLSKKIDLNIFKNKKLCHDLFNIKETDYNNINFDEVNYLFETVRMKSILSKQESTITVLTYKGILTSYLIIGLEETINLINDGDKNITLAEVKKLQQEIINEKMLIFKENNSSIFQNMAKKIISNLHEIEPTEDINKFAHQVRKNTYLDNIIYLMLNNNFDSYNEIIEKLYGYQHYFKYDKYNSKKDIYEYTQSFTNLYLDNKKQEYIKDFENIILRNFKVKENIIYSKRKEIGRNFLKKLKFKLFVRALTDPNKESYKEYFIDDYPINNIKNEYKKHLANENVDFESILQHVLTPIINERFDKENCLNKLGITKPKNTDDYLKYLYDLKCIVKLNNKINKFKKLYTYKQTLEIMNYICYKSNLTFKLKKKEQNELDKLSNIINNLDGEIYIDKTVLKFIYQNNIDIYNIEEIIEYNKYLEILDNIINKTISYINKIMDEEKIKTIFAHDYFKIVNTDDCTFPITSKYYEPKKRVLSLLDLEQLLSGYDLSNYKPIDETLKDFLFTKKNLIMVADGYYNGIVDNLGTIISKWQEINDFSKELNINISKSSLISIENILNLINLHNNTLGKSIEKDIIKNTYIDDYYEINDLNKRINILTDLYKETFKRITSTIPYLCYKDDIYKVEIIDNYNQDILRNINKSVYKVGALGNDFLHYSILNKNGFQIGIYKNNILTSKILGIRNGNTIYLNSLEGPQDPNYNDLLRLFANKLISITRDDKEPIEFITIVNNETYSNINAPTIDQTICPIINNPFNKSYYDFEEFVKNKNLLNPEEIYANYKDNITTLLASNNIIDKNNFKYYDAEPKYYRLRNNVIKLSNNLGEEYINKIETILYLCKLEDESIDIDDICLNAIDTIYLGDDYVIFITERNNILKYILPYDKRAPKEINMLLETLNLN